MIFCNNIVSNCTEESGKLIVSGIINPEEMKKIKAKQRKEERQQKLIESKKSKPRITEEDKKKILFDKYCNKVSKLNKNIKVLSYQGAKEKSAYKCLLCNNEWSCRADHFLEKGKCKCPKCKK